MLYKALHQFIADMSRERIFRRVAVDDKDFHCEIPLNAKQLLEVAFHVIYMQARWLCKKLRGSLPVEFNDSQNA